MLWEWFDCGNRVWTYWRIRRATRCYLLLVPRTDVGDLMKERDPYNGRRVYVLIRFPADVS